MNLLKSLAAVAIMAATLAACNSEELLINPGDQQLTRALTVNLVSEDDAATRTYVEASSGRLCWLNGDKVSYFTSADGEAWSTSKTATVVEGRFTAEVGTGDTQIRVIYPAIEEGQPYAKPTVKEDQTCVPGQATAELLPGIFTEEELAAIDEGTASDEEKAAFDARKPVAIRNNTIPMEVEPIAIPAGNEINAPYKVLGAVIRVKVVTNTETHPMADDKRGVTRISLGNYIAGISGNTNYPLYKNGEKNFGGIYVVVPVGEDIEITPTIIALNKKTDNLNDKLTYTLKSKKINTLRAKTYSLTVNIDDDETVRSYTGWPDEIYSDAYGGYHNGHYFMDLGLPSGTLWAISNIGANSPQDYGDYFAWGETSPKESYTWNNYLTNLGATISSIDDCATDKDPLASYTWYKSNYTEAEDAGTPDGIGGTEYDPAHVLWGGKWRLPTDAEIQELIKYTTRDFGKFINSANSGYSLQSKKNGRYLELPASGYRSGTSDNDSKGNQVVFWGSTVQANNAVMYSGGKNPYSNNEIPADASYFYRFYGLPIRPVLNVPKSELLSTTTIANEGEAED